MMKAKQSEIRDLIDRCTFRAVLRTELADGANMITPRYVLAIKSEEDKEDRYKARYVAGGHQDIMKDYLVHGAQTMQCVSVRLILVIAKGKGLRIWTMDVKLAYLQSNKPLTRKTFINNSAPEFELSLEEVLERC